MNTLLLRLGGPLQSWGSESKYDDRRTDAFPTKSGVIGMVAAAMGRRRDQEIDDLVSQLKFGVRIDREGTVINDFQITDMAPFYKANVSNRKYLSDALFLAGLEGPDDLLSAAENALEHPVFPLYLGRRSCPPDRPVVLGTREKNLYQALYDEPWQVSDWRKARAYPVLRIIVESEKGTKKRDVPISFSPSHRDYTYRAIAECPPRVMQSVSGEDHDAMGELR